MVTHKSCDKSCDKHATRLSHGVSVGRRPRDSKNGVLSGLSRFCRTVAFPRGATMRIGVRLRDSRCDSHATA